MTHKNLKTTTPSNIACATATYRSLALEEFAAEINAGLSLALYHLAAVPGIATTLQSTGHLAERPELRVDEVSRLLVTLLLHGFDEAGSRAAIRVMNRVHREFEVPNDHYLYALSLFVVVPTRYIDSTGSRTLSTDERKAVASFYAELGRLMGVKDIPQTYAAFEEYCDVYERRHVRTSPAGRELAAAIRSFHDARLFGNLLDKASPAVHAAITVASGTMSEERAPSRCPFGYTSPRYVEAVSSKVVK
ncbi:oxygenase MpaB family protein [Streptomyces wedmorensis]|uniref:oxygenase MpaB family protein n=1 Tax=Streptomyces wedmorensis TaxID=43759 RepID=UPI003795CAB9